MKMRALLSLCSVSLLFLGGCASYFEDQRMEAARQRMESENQRTEVEQLRARVEALEKIQQDLDSRMAAMRADNDKQRQEVREQLAGMDRLLKTYEAARAADKQEIISDLSAKIAKIGETMRPPPPPIRPVTAPPGGSTKGKEHVVQPGETLSAIAAAYKVKASALVQANDLKNADSLKVGQRLIIPE